MATIKDKPTTRAFVLKNGDVVPASTLDRFAVKSLAEQAAGSRQIEDDLFANQYTEMQVIQPQYDPGTHRCRGDGPKHLPLPMCPGQSAGCHWTGVEAGSRIQKRRRRSGSLTKLKRPPCWSFSVNLTRRRPSKKSSSSFGRTMRPSMGGPGNHSKQPGEPATDHGAPMDSGAHHSHPS